MTEPIYRLITRADFDGVVCGSLLSERGLIGGDVLFVHPKDMQDGNVSVTGGDIVANLPYAEAAHLCFDHHVSETQRVGARDNLVIDADAPSTARVIYNHYGGRKGFPAVSEEMLAAVDKADSAAFEVDEILAPSDWTLLNFVLDPRTGLEEFKDFALSRDALMIELITFCKHNPIDEILSHPDVSERVNAFTYHSEFAELQITRCARVRGKTVVVDFRGEDKRYPGNRFMVYALYPDCDLSVTVAPGRKAGVTEIALGKSILDRGSPVNIGTLMLDYGGGGHAGAGTCQVPDAEVDRTLDDILERIGAAAA